MGLERTERRLDFPEIPNSVQSGVQIPSQADVVAMRVQSALEQQRQELEFQTTERVRAEKTLADLKEAAELARGTTQIFESTAATHERNAEVLKETTSIYNQLAKDQDELIARMKAFDQKYQAHLDEMRANNEEMRASIEKSRKESEPARALLATIADPESCKARADRLRGWKEFIKEQKAQNEKTRRFIEENIKKPVQLVRSPEPQPSASSICKQAESVMVTPSTAPDSPAASTLSSQSVPISEQASESTIVSQSTAPDSPAAPVLPLQSVPIPEQAIAKSDVPNSQQDAKNLQPFSAGAANLPSQEGTSAALTKTNEKVSNLFSSLNFESMGKAISSLWHCIIRVLHLSK